MTIRNKISILIGVIALFILCTSVLSLILFRYEMEKVRLRTIDSARHIFMKAVQNKADDFISRIAEEIRSMKKSEKEQYFEKWFASHNPEEDEDVREIIFSFGKDLMVFPRKPYSSQQLVLEKKSFEIAKKGGGDSFYEENNRVYFLNVVLIPDSIYWHAVRIDVTNIIADYIKVFQPVGLLFHYTVIGIIFTTILIIVSIIVVSYPVIKKIDLLEKKLTSKNDELTQMNLLLNVEVDIRKNIENELKVANRELKQISTIDSLTKISNRRHFDHVFAKEWHIHLREKRNISILMCDIDFFKKYNDTYGHQKGDRCLVQVASILKKECRRPSDFAARYGGEEFVIILPETDADGAAAIAEKICKAVSTRNIPHSASLISKHVTISIGVATEIPDISTSPDMLLKKADGALYNAKESGKNIWKVYG
jgi:diguanylate cyclase (GGDEF)-like protein